MPQEKRRASELYEELRRELEELVKALRKTEEVLRD